MKAADHKVSRIELFHAGNERGPLRCFRLGDDLEAGNLRILDLLQVVGIVDGKWADAGALARSTAKVAFGGKPLDGLFGNLQESCGLRFGEPVIKNRVIHPSSVARPRDTLDRPCPTGLQSVCNRVLWELREERSEAAKREAPPLSTLTPSKAGRWRRSLRLS